MPCIVEVCVDSLDSALSAEVGGAGRLEVCSALYEGGLTPSHGLVQAICRSISNCKVHVLIRPRSGDFVYSNQEIGIIRSDIVHFASLGVDGVVLGCLTPHATINIDLLQDFTTLCSALGLDLTFHRAFDVVHDQIRALNDLIGCGVKRVLTSGGARGAMEGLERICELVKEGQGKITIMPAGGIDVDNCGTIVRVAGVTEIHGTFKAVVPSRMVWFHPRVHFAPISGIARKKVTTGYVDDDSNEGGAGGEGGVLAEKWQRYVCDSEAVKRVCMTVKEIADEEDNSTMN